MKVEIDKDVLFEFINSHSKLAQDKYDHDSSYDTSHYSYIAENKMIEEMAEAGILEEYLTQQ